MDLLTTAATVVLFTLALLLILYPIWQQFASGTMDLAGPAVPVDETGHTLAEYEVRYDAALAAIKNLIFGYEAGKLAEADHQLLLSKAKAEAAAIRHQLDLLSRQLKPAITDELDAEIERLIANFRRRNLS